jgi:regulator of RNase E activity RraB
MADWQYYDCTDKQGQLQVILVDLDYQRRADIQRDRPWLMLVTVGHRGIEFSGGLDEVQRKVVGVMASWGQGVLVARVDRANASELWFYGRIANDPIAAIKAVMDTRSAVFTCVLEDKSWNGYRTSVLPHTPIQVQQVINGQIVRRLIERGDDVRQPRSIQHAFAFSVADRIPVFVAILDREGFANVRKADSNDAVHRFMVICEQRLPNLSIKAINATTKTLMEIATPFDARYDGWGSEVTKGAIVNR